MPEGYIVGPDGTLQANNAAEEYEPKDLAEDQVEAEGEEVYGRGKRRAVANRHYAEFWRH